MNEFTKIQYNLIDHIQKFSKNNSSSLENKPINEISTEKIRNLYESLSNNDYEKFLLELKKKNIEKTILFLNKKLSEKEVSLYEYANPKK